MGAWDLYKQVKTNVHAPAWLQWMAGAWLIAIVLGILWFRFGSATPDDAALRASVGAGQATVSVPADRGAAFCVGFHWSYRDDVKTLAGDHLRTDEVLTVDKLQLLENSGACP